MNRSNISFIMVLLLLMTTPGVTASDHSSTSLPSSDWVNLLEIGDTGIIDNKFLDLDEMILNSSRIMIEYQGVSYQMKVYEKNLYARHSGVLGEEGPITFGGWIEGIDSFLALTINKTEMFGTIVMGAPICQEVFFSTSWFHSGDTTTVGSESVHHTTLSDWYTKETTRQFPSNHHCISASNNSYGSPSRSYQTISYIPDDESSQSQTVTLLHQRTKAIRLSLVIDPNASRNHTEVLHQFNVVDEIYRFRIQSSLFISHIYQIPRFEHATDTSYVSIDCMNRSNTPRTEVHRYVWDTFVNQTDAWYEWNYGPIDDHIIAVVGDANSTRLTDVRACVAYDRVQNSAIYSVNDEPHPTVIIAGYWGSDESLFGLRNFIRYTGSSTFSYMQWNLSPFSPPVTLAHEIGHSFGAQHTDGVFLCSEIEIVLNGSVFDFYSTNGLMKSGDCMSMKSTMTPNYASLTQSQIGMLYVIDNFRVSSNALVKLDRTGNTSLDGLSFMRWEVMPFTHNPISVKWSSSSGNVNSKWNGLSYIIETKDLSSPIPMPSCSGVFSLFSGISTDVNTSGINHSWQISSTGNHQHQSSLNNSWQSSINPSAEVQWLNLTARYNLDLMGGFIFSEDEIECPSYIHPGYIPEVGNQSTSDLYLRPMLSFPSHDVIPAHYIVFETLDV